MKKKWIVTAIGLLWVGISSFGQSVKVDGEIRSRAELRNGFREPLADSLNAAYVNNLRTKLNLSYSSETVKAKISLLDTRTYGSTAISSTGQGVGILEAWGEYNFTPALSLAIGRQGLEYDDKRLFSYNNWSNTPGAHDLLLLKYKKNGLTVNLGSAYNNAGDSTQFLSPYKLNYKALNFIWISKIFQSVSTSALWVNDSFQNGKTGNITTSYRNTVGGNVWTTNPKDPFTFFLSGYYQFGRNKSNKSLSAYLLSLNLSEKLDSKWTIHEGADWISGTGTSSKDHTFNKLYGTNHAFNGSIEYWATLPTQGLVDFNLGVTAKLTPKFDADATFHHFSTSKEISSIGKKNIGSEIDLTLNYTVNQLFSLQGGWSAYFTTKGTEVLKKKTDVNTRFPQWAYIQVTFKPVFWKNQ